MDINEHLGSKYQAGWWVGDCRLIKRHAVGGLYEVWLAEYRGQNIAVKVVRIDTADSDLIRKLLRREAKLLPHLVGIRHVVQAVDMGTDWVPLAVFMEFIQGPSLSNVLKRSLADNQLPLGWDYLQPLMLQACTGMQSLHQIKVFQADYKPDNLLVGPTGELVIIDFSIADAYGRAWIDTGILPISCLEPDGHFLGTVVHVAPERIEGEPPGVRSDVYSLMSSLYHLLTGRPPFCLHQPGLVMRRKLNRDAPPLAADGLPPGLPGIIRSGLDRNPDQRPQTARELSEVLACLLHP